MTAAIPDWPDLQFGGEDMEPAVMKKKWFGHAMYTCIEENTI